MKEKQIDFKQATLQDITQDLQGVLALIQQLQGGARFRYSWEHLREILVRLCVGHRWLGYPVAAGLLLFRGRISNEVEFFENVKSLSFRPPEEVRDYGRCHRPKCSVFYGATNLDTVLSELDPEIGDRVHVAVARVKSGEQIALTAIGEIDHVRRYRHALIGDETARVEWQKFLDGMASSFDLKTLLLDAFFSELFIAPARTKKDYKITSALSDILFSTPGDERSNLVDGFAYPSVAHRGGLNYVIRADRFQMTMEMHHCI